MSTDVLTACVDGGHCSRNHFLNGLTRTARLRVGDRR